VNDGQDAKSNQANSAANAVGEDALRRLKAANVPLSPRSFEVFYAAARGDNAAVASALENMVSTGQFISLNDIDRLHESYITSRGFSAHAERTSAGVLVEIDHVMEMMDLVLGSTANYGESLVTLTEDLNNGADRNRVREIVATLVHATREASATNKTLEARLRETRGEISTLRETLECVRVEALTDAVTGLANRKHFDEMLIKGIDQATIHRSQLTLIMADIDHFKHFNDTYGHLTGDQVLRLVGMTLRDRVKRKATLARFGGEEFGIILPDVTLETAFEVAETVRKSVMSRELVKRSTGESLGRVTISVGVASVKVGDTAATFLERSDHCMLTAKRMGRNQTVLETDPAALEFNMSNVA
jgi:diguanylate cyclase